MWEVEFLDGFWGATHALKRDGVRWTPFSMSTRRLAFIYVCGERLAKHVILHVPIHTSPLIKGAAYPGQSPGSSFFNFDVDVTLLVSGLTNPIPASAVGTEFTRMIRGCVQLIFNGTSLISLAVKRLIFWWNLTALLRKVTRSNLIQS